MNRKEAEMNVLWEGKPTQFKNINDPVVLPRLNATLDAHKLLWSIRLLVRRSLTPEQQQLAMDLCEIELLCHHKERAEKKKGIYTQVVERALAAENRSIPPSAKVFWNESARSYVISRLQVTTVKTSRSGCVKQSI